MLVSIEVLTTVISAAGLLIALAAGFGWMINHTDSRIDGVEHKLTERIDGLEQKLTERIDAVQHELVEVKIAVARLEGPRPHLVTPR